MTAVDERRMTELFENLEVPEGVKIELLRGEIVMMAGPDLVHNRIVRSVALQLPSDRWEWLMTQDIDILSEQSEPVPDLVVLKSDAGPDSGRLLPSGVVTMLVEVVSKNSVDRDYGIKRGIYAAGKVPAYLIIDPIVAHCVLLTEPAGVGDAADYAVQRITKFGDPVPLELLGIELDTSEFGTLPNVRPHRRP
ncbi:Uma2 family endonuclease [Streptomyces sp. RPA4-5]|uniref:Uma2 family endonuclease n=1 Tax=Streptomyces TaxID=1883 RepID=UPI00143EA220|nr:MULTISPECIES: Uma2 family endonuclease [Streptomyces]MCX4634336.1 Uma2 family endonuclease [Streptomyces platensis]QIY55486.1 Uma2 family endonuclease [Streptomyces sp. RPA4-5]